MSAFGECEWVLRGAASVFPLFEEGADVSEANAGGVGSRSLSFHAGLAGDRHATPPARSPWLACPPPLQRGGKLLFLGLSLVFLLFEASLTAEEGAAQRPPNFVFILGEGHGWSSTSVQIDDGVPGSKGSVVKTPSLERLAREGMRFANAYASAPRCTPSRASIFTGKSPAQLHMTFIGEGKGDTIGGDGYKMIPPDCILEMPAKEVTIAEFLKQAGYATAHFGKWHVGRVSPKEHGFDESDGATSNVGPNHNENPNPAEGFGMTERGNAFMAAQVKAGKPFYLQMSHYAGRSGADVRKETMESVTARAGDLKEKEIGEIGAVEDMDAAIGLVLKKIDELGIAGNTYVLYMPDHGTPGRNLPLSGGKGWLTEGGLRVPLIIRGTGIKAGACSHVPVVNFDLFPTFAELAGAKAPLPAGIDGGSLVPLLTHEGSGTVKRPREELVFHYPHYDHGNEGPSSAIILGNLKLIKVYETDSAHLYDLSKDISERRDLAKEMPEKAAELAQKLSDDLKACNAQMATMNPNYDPTKTPPPKKGGGEGGGGKRKSKQQ